MVKFLTAIYAGKTNTFGAVVVEDFDGVAVENRNDEAGEVSNGSGGAEHEQERAESKDTYSSRPREWRRDKKTLIR